MDARSRLGQNRQRIRAATVRVVLITLVIAVCYVGLFGYWAAQDSAGAEALRRAEWEQRAIVWSAGFVILLTIPVLIALRELVAHDRALEHETTERQKAQAALALIQERLQLALDSVDDGFWDWDIPSGQCYFSPRYYAMLGYAPDEFPPCHTSWQDLTHPDDVVCVERALLQHFEQRQEYDLEYRMRRKDGEWCWINDRGTAIQFDENGRPLRMVGTHSDVTERRRAEDALAAEHALLRTLIDTLPDRIYAKDTQSRFVLNNMAHLQALGVSSQEEALGKTDYDFRPPDIAAHCHADDLRVLQGQSIHNREEPNVSATGEGGWILVTKVPLRDAGGQMVGLVGISRNITERRRIEEALRESENRLRTLINAMPDIVCFKDGQGRWLEANDFDLRLFELEGVEYRGKKDSELAAYSSFYRDAFLTCEDSDELAWRLGRPSRGDEIIPRPDGTAQVFDIIKVPTFYPDGRRQGLVVIGRDITDRQRVQKALQESETRYHSLFEDSPISMWEEDFSQVKLYLDNLRASGITDLRAYFEQHPQAVAECAALVRVLDVNKATLALMDARDKDELGVGLAQNLAEEAHAPFREELVALAEGAQRYECDEVTRSLSGEEKFITVVISIPPGHADTWDRVLVSILDITERRRAEEALRQLNAELEERVVARMAELRATNAELVRANRLKDEFLATMSHELRTPLTAILGLSESLQEGVYGPLSDKQLKSLKTIETSGRHLLGLITDILDLSKIGAGKVELQRSAVPADGVCQASLQFIRQTALKKQLRVSFESDPQVKAIEADERRLKQMLVNLLSNAVKFTPDGGAVGLQVRGDAAQRVVHLTVWDTGIGLAEQDMARLFQPFVQLDASLSRQYTGTGLGLALVKQLTELHGGHVSVESQVGQGSRFTLSLPWQPADASVPVAERMSPSGSAAVSPSVRSTRVLVVEDTESNLSLMRDYLESRQYEVLVAHSGQEAIQQAKTGGPDVIVMDVQMPGMDGLEAIRRIRALPAFADLPIIAMTGLAMPGDEQRCLEAGANGYLTKPISLKELLRAIRELLDRQANLKI